MIAYANYQLAAMGARERLSCRSPGDTPFPGPQMPSAIINAARQAERRLAAQSALIRHQQQVINNQTQTIRDLRRVLGRITAAQAAAVALLQEPHRDHRQDTGAAVPQDEPDQDLRPDTSIADSPSPDPAVTSTLTPELSPPSPDSTDYEPDDFMGALTPELPPPSPDHANHDDFMDNRPPSGLLTFTYGTGEKAKLSNNKSSIDSTEDTTLRDLHASLHEFEPTDSDGDTSSTTNHDFESAPNKQTSPTDRMGTTSLPSTLPLR